MTRNPGSVCAGHGRPGADESGFARNAQDKYRPKSRIIWRSSPTLEDQLIGDTPKVLGDRMSDMLGQMPSQDASTVTAPDHVEKNRSGIQMLGQLGDELLGSAQFALVMYKIIFSLP